MEKVYVLVTEVAIDGVVETDQRVKVFSTREKAQEALDAFAIGERKPCEENDWVIENNPDGSGSYTNGWEAYIEGESVYNHSYAYVVEREVL